MTDSIGYRRQLGGYRACLEERNKQVVAYTAFEGDNRAKSVCLECDFQAEKFGYMATFYIDSFQVNPDQKSKQTIRL